MEPIREQRGVMWHLVMQRGHQVPENLVMVMVMKAQWFLMVLTLRTSLLQPISEKPFLLLTFLPLLPCS